ARRKRVSRWRSWRCRPSRRCSVRCPRRRLSPTSARTGATSSSRSSVLRKKRTVHLCGSPGDTGSRRLNVSTVSLVSLPPEMRNRLRDSVLRGLPLGKPPVVSSLRQRGAIHPLLDPFLLAQSRDGSDFLGDGSKVTLVCLHLWCEIKVGQRVHDV